MAKKQEKIMAKEVKITTEYITLGQFLKFVGIIDSGFLAKIYLSENEVLINGEVDCRRGRKCFCKISGSNRRL